MPSQNDTLRGPALLSQVAKINNTLHKIPTISYFTNANCTVSLITQNNIIQSIKLRGINQFDVHNCETRSNSIFQLNTSIIVHTYGQQHK